MSSTQVIQKPLGFLYGPGTKVRTYDGFVGIVVGYFSSTYHDRGYVIQNSRTGMLTTHPETLITSYK